MEKKYYIPILAILIILLGCKKVNVDCNMNDYPNAPAIEWSTGVNGSGEESHGHQILSCSDGGFLQIGETGFIPNSAKILVVKTDENGSLIWKKEFGDEGNNLGNSVIETPYSYMICGALNENSTVIKLNKLDGSLLFKETTNNGGNDAYEDLILTSTGIVAIGYVNAEDHTNTFYTGGEGYISFLDSNGIKKDGKNINQYVSQAYRIETFNNELYISGLTENANDYGLVKMDSIGNIIWNKKYGGSSADHCFGMDLGVDGSVFLTGHTLSGTENWDTYTIKINSSGSQIWETKAGNPRGFKPKFIHDEAWGVKSTSDGGCIIVAGTGDEYGRYKRRCGSDGDNSNTWHIYLVKFNSIGNIEWQKTYGGGKGIDWAGEAIDLTSDGGVIVALDNGKFGFVKIEPF
ncbi:MAG: hypothetical protein P8Q42_06190 [Flavobacteriales bacterium]|nr:hypothetical protein [Flavobacteriales bacterium]